jgi:1L-myo-inositol 1-phosphate cytidylyltransferase
MDHSGDVTQTVILAAGNGSRLARESAGIPKPLMTVGGIPLLAHALSHARASGCLEAIIVVGHERERVANAARSMSSGLALRFVETPDPSAPNGVSLLAAAPLAAPRFFLQMVDHLFAEVALPKLTRVALAGDEGGRVLVDRAPGDIDLEDATKVRLDGERVVAIGKCIEPWDVVDAGCFVLTGAIFEALSEAPATEPRTVSSGMRRLAALGLLGAVDVDGIEWVDVDTPADRESAERLLVQRAVVGGTASRY